MVTIDLITDIVCDHFMVEKESVLMKDSCGFETRRTEYTKVRHYAMYLCRHFKLGSLEFIGEYFNRNHSSVIHACHRVEDEIYIYPKKEVVINNLITKIDEQGAKKELPEMSVYPDYITA
jgi:chromosomal replication initiator protein